MSTMRKYEKPVDQLELTPRVDFSKETLLEAGGRGAPVGGEAVVDL